METQRRNVKNQKTTNDDDDELAKSRNAMKIK